MSSLEGFYAKQGDITVDVNGTVFIQRCGYLIIQDGCVLMLFMLPMMKRRISLYLVAVWRWACRRRKV